MAFSSPASSLSEQSHKSELLRKSFSYNEELDQMRHEIYYFIKKRLSYPQQISALQIVGYHSVGDMLQIVKELDYKDIANRDSPHLTSQEKTEILKAQGWEEELRNNLLRAIRSDSKLQARYPDLSKIYISSKQFLTKSEPLTNNKFQDFVETYYAEFLKDKRVKNHDNTEYFSGTKDDYKVESLLARMLSSKLTQDDIHNKESSLDLARKGAFYLNQTFKFGRRQVAEAIEVLKTQIQKQKLRLIHTRTLEDTEEVRAYYTREDHDLLSPEEQRALPYAAEYDSIHKFSDGVAKVTKNGQTNFITPEGKLLRDKRRAGDPLTPFSDWYTQTNGEIKRGDREKSNPFRRLLDKTGEIILPYEYSKISRENGRIQGFERNHNGQIDHIIDTYEYTNTNPEFTMLTMLQGKTKRDPAKIRKYLTQASLNKKYRQQIFDQNHVSDHITQEMTQTINKQLQQQPKDFLDSIIARKPKKYNTLEYMAPKQDNEPKHTTNTSRDRELIKNIQTIFSSKKSQPNEAWGEKKAQGEGGFENDDWISPNRIHDEEVLPSMSTEEKTPLNESHEALAEIRKNLTGLISEYQQRPKGKGSLLYAGIIQNIKKLPAEERGQRRDQISS